MADSSEKSPHDVMSTVNDPSGNEKPKTMPKDQSMDTNLGKAVTKTELLVQDNKLVNEVNSVVVTLIMLIDLVLNMYICEL